MFNLSGKFAVITGASSGLGRQMARALARQGASAALLARRVERLEALKAELEEATKSAKNAAAQTTPGPASASKTANKPQNTAKTAKAEQRFLALHCDVTDSENINAAAEKIESAFGRVDILVNCAGSSKDKGVLEMADDEWDFTIATDETSVFKMTRAFGKIMAKNNYGRIINIASMYGLVGNTEIPTIAYHASKGAVVNFTRAVAAELATQGITCNAICPGYFETELTKAVLDTERFQAFAKTHVPMQRYGKEGELDAAVVFLASDEARYVTGAILPVDGGYTAV